jgi:hypothetical protein
MAPSCWNDSNRLRMLWTPTTCLIAMIALATREPMILQAVTQLRPTLQAIMQHLRMLRRRLHALRSF